MRVGKRNARMMMIDGHDSHESFMSLQFLYIEKRCMVQLFGNKILIWSKMPKKIGCEVDILRPCQDIAESLQVCLIIFNLYVWCELPICHKAERP